MGFRVNPKAVLLHDAITGWRAWLTSGVRRVPIDARRASGADAQVKKILMGGPSSAADFSGAMARQAIDEAMNELPTQHRQVVKLAYFGGLTNRQIAQQLSLTVGGVRSRLRDSLATISAYIERGRAVGRRAVQSLLIWFSWRQADAQRVHGPAVDQVLQAGVVAVMTVAAAALLVTHHTPHSQVAHPHKMPNVASSSSAPSHLQHVQTTAPATVGAPVLRVDVVDAASQALSLPPVPATVQIPALPVTLPVALPSVPPLRSPLPSPPGILP